MSGGGEEGGERGLGTDQAEEDRGLAARERDAVAERGGEFGKAGVRIDEVELERSLGLGGVAITSERAAQERPGGGGNVAGV